MSPIWHNGFKSWDGDGRRLPRPPVPVRGRKGSFGLPDSRRGRRSTTYRSVSLKCVHCAAFVGLVNNGKTVFFFFGREGGRKAIRTVILTCLSPPPFFFLPFFYKSVKIKLEEKRSGGRKAEEEGGGDLEANSMFREKEGEKLLGRRSR